MVKWKPQAANHGGLRRSEAAARIWNIASKSIHCIQLPVQTNKKRFGADGNAGTHSSKSPSKHHDVIMREETADEAMFKMSTSPINILSAKAHSIALVQS